jgi:tetratricopeptide (TPR) repeat protein
MAPAESRAEFVAKIRAHPKRSERILLLADTAEIAIDPAALPRVAENLVGRLKKGKPEDRIIAAMWLNSQGRPREALELIPPEEAISNAAALRTWLDSAAALGEWDAMIGVLARKDVPLPPHMVRVYTARALKMDGRSAEGEAAYRAALEEFRDKPQETVEVLEYLQRSGEYGIFNEGFKAGMEKPSEAFDMVARLVPVVLDARDSARMREVLGMALASPNLSDAVPLLNDAAYLDLVLGRPVDGDSLRARLKEFPKDPAIFFTLALERLRNGNAREALAMIEQANPDVNSLAPNHLTVLACVLAENGRKDEALRTAARIPASRISAQELEMLRTALTAGEEQPVRTEQNRKSPATR